MNRTILTEELQQELIVKLRRNYFYDAKKGILVNRESNKAVKGQMKKNGYLQVTMRLKGKRILYYYHRLIWAYFHCRFPTLQLDHINGMKTDNRIVNLREVTQTQNMLNRVHQWKPNKQSGYPGVCYTKTGFWKIRVCQEQIYFKDRHEAFFHVIMLGRQFSKCKTKDEKSEKK